MADGLRPLAACGLTGRAHFRGIRSSVVEPARGQARGSLLSGLAGAARPRQDGGRCLRDAPSLRRRAADDARGDRRRRRADRCPRALTVGSVTAAPGQLASGWIEVPDGVDPGTRIPVTVANGAAPGPVLALVAGTHGSEYTSILALQRLRPRLEPARMRGAAILVHMANPPAFYGRRDLLQPRRQEPEPRLPGQARRHGERADGARDHARGDRPVHSPRRHALRRRQRVAPAVHLLDRRRRRRRRRPVARARPRLRPRPHPRRPRAPAGPRRQPLHRQHGDHPRASPRSRPSRGDSAPRTSRRWRPTRPARARCSRISASWTGRRRAWRTPSGSTARRSCAPP